MCIYTEINTNTVSIIRSKWLSIVQLQVPSLSKYENHRPHICAAYVSHTWKYGEAKTIDKNDTKYFFACGNDEIQKNGKEFAMLFFYQCGVNGMKNTLLIRTMPPIIPIAITFDFSRFFILIPYLREGTITRVVSAVYYFSNIPSLIA